MSFIKGFHVRGHGQASLVPEAICVGDCVGFLRGRVNALMLLGFGFNRKDFHKFSFFAAPAAITFITPVRNTSKRILEEIWGGDGQAILPPRRLVQMRAEEGR